MWIDCPRIRCKLGDSNSEKRPPINLLRNSENDEGKLTVMPVVSSTPILVGLGTTPINRNHHHPSPNKASVCDVVRSRILRTRDQTVCVACLSGNSDLGSSIEFSCVSTCSAVRNPF